MGSKPKKRPSQGPVTKRGWCRELPSLWNRTGVCVSRREWGEKELLKWERAYLWPSAIRRPAVGKLLHYRVEQNKPF